MAQHNIKNIIFDLGGILLTIDYQKTEDAFIALGVQNFKALYAQHHASHLFEQLEIGAISNDAFFDTLRATANVNLSNEQITTAWNAMLGQFPPERIDALQALGKRYRIFLYSNTNAIHHAAFMHMFEQQFPGTTFDGMFEKAYYSHTFGYRKPYASSYTQLLADAGLAAHETLFIDDTLVNIDGAKAAGLLTAHVVPPTTFLSLAL